MFFKKALILTALSLLLVCTLTATTTPNPSVTLQKMNQMPLAFTRNMGQWDERVLFRANADGATMWFTTEGVTYQFTRRISGHSRAGGDTGFVGVAPRGYPHEGNHMGLPLHDPDDRDSIEQLVLTAKFIGANPNPEIVGEGLIEYKCNYFLGNDPMKWHTDVPNYEAITLKDIYPGIDLKYSGDGNGQAAYEFVVAQGADVAQIKIEYEGAEETSIDSDGRLVLRTKWGDMIAAVGSTVNRTGLASPRFVLNSEHTLGFAVDGQSLAQAKSGTLTLSYSTFLGGGGGDGGYGGIAVDGGGNAYVTGSTSSSDFPTLNPYQTDQGGWDVFVTKLSCTNSGLIYSTYLGGGSDDWGEGIAVDDSGNAYVTGSTWSSDLPTLSPYQTDQGGGDVFVVKLSSSGDSLIYSTYLGGESYDEGQGIAVDGSGAYVTGSTQSSDFPTLNSYQTDQGGVDAFVTKLSSSGNSLIYSTYLGGGSEDYGWDIAVDDSDNAYVTGRTSSSDFPTLNPYQTYQGSVDAFVVKLSNSGSSLMYSTFLGGSGPENEYDSDHHMGGIAVDGSGNAYVMGSTYSSNFSTLNPYQGYQGNMDVFMTELSSTGNSLIYSTYLGGSGNDWGEDIAIDGSGNAYVTGVTWSPDFPTLNPYQSYLNGYYDVFVTKLSNTGNSLIYSTYLGGGDGDAGWGIAIDGSGNAYVAGSTLSSDFPTLNPYQMYQFWDAFVTKLSWTPNYTCGDADGEGTINIADAVYLIAYIFSHGPAPSPLAAGDADCSGDINIADVVYLISYIFSHGPEPCATCK